jgi:hypothetical protein
MGEKLSTSMGLPTSIGVGGKTLNKYGSMDVWKYGSSGIRE